jgi:hypothetical protein
MLPTKGLLSLTVEFYRMSGISCTTDVFGNPIPQSASLFPYGNTNVTCGIVCDPDDPASPTSPMRGGSANNIYIIPVPELLDFGAATLLGAACCIPAILTLISMWNKILEINWKKRFGPPPEELINEPIEGTNGATIESMRGVNNVVSLLLSAIEIPVFVGAVFAILVVGERNFWSYQVRYQTEPIAAVGRLSPSLFAIIPICCMSIGRSWLTNCCFQANGRPLSVPSSPH